MKRVVAVTIPMCLASAPGRMRKRSIAPGSGVGGTISIIASRAASASTSRGPVSPQSRL